MSGVRDSAIKLFGKTIPLPPNGEASTSSTVTPADGDDHKQHCSSPRDKICDRVGDGKEDNKTSEPGFSVVALQKTTEFLCRQKLSEIEVTKIRQENSTSHPTAEELKDQATSCEVSQDPKAPSFDEEPTSPKDSKNDEQSETNISQEKTLKKPDKIIPCPRCNSMDTKFCYYNNYNVNQPRHFCKNCQRYWTSGGTMRNVPVGSGRRKSKSSSASHYRHIIVSDALQAPLSDAGNGSVLTFGSDAPLCESMASSLNLAEKSQNHAHNGFHGPGHKIFVPSRGSENGDDQTSRSSITVSDSAHKGGNSAFQESVMKNFHTSHPQLTYFPGPPWPCQWSSPQWRPGMPPPGFGPPGFPVAFYPAPPYWGCSAPPGPWNVPWLSPPPEPTSPNSPNLGKHSRDGNMLNPSNSEREDSSKENDSQKYVWIPKTLRFDDPSEAAKSTILSTLNDSISGGGLLKAFHSKGDAKNHRAETSLVLQANPAALSRSLNFRESA